MGNYITILEWMRDLGLRGNELLTYAIVYSFSRDGESSYKGSASYVAEWLSSTPKTARTILNSLADRGFIEKIERWENNVKFCDYRVGKNMTGREKTSQGVGKNFPQGREKTSHHNNIDNADINISANNKISQPVVFDFYLSLIYLGVTEQTAKDYMAVRKAKKAVNTLTAFEAISEQIKQSGQSAEFCIRTAVLRNWAGFKAAWLQDNKGPQDQSNDSPSEATMEYVRQIKARRQAEEAERLKQQHS